MKKQHVYYLHYRLRKLGYRLNTRKKTVFVGAKEYEQKSYSAIVSKYFDELMMIDYGIQATIM